ncbi:MAG: orotidine 5'-phosphate decarboxylase / HUMPS family protein [Streptococcus thermophilus]
MLSTRSRKIKDATNEDFVCLTPGIRPAEQRLVTKNVSVPTDASIGSDYIVVGRPITQADDPVAAYHDIKAQWTVNKFSKRPYFIGK